MAIRGSEVLGVLIPVASDARVSFRAVELAGRGIAADARATGWALAGKGALGGVELADLLIAHGELVEELTAGWRAFDGGQLSSDELDARLETFVEGVEALYRDHW